MSAASTALPGRLRSPKFPNYPSNLTRHISCRLSLNRTDENPPLSSPHHDPLRIVLAAGGTGGHIYPAIAMADELRIASPSVQCVFLGSASGMESEAVPTAGHEFRPIVLSPENLLLFPFSLLRSIAAALTTLREVGPRVVVGTGGYVSLPVCLAAAVLGVRVVIQEQNSTPGIANRVLSVLASKVFVAFPSCSRFFPKEKCFVTGNPVRASLLKYTSKVVARSHFFPGRKVGEGGKVVLVLGGSTGACEINIAMLNLYREMLEDHKEMFLIWQTGYDGFDEMESLVKNHQRVVLTQFLHTMDLAYAAADLVVSRAGATTCTEILVTGKPSILIPAHYVVDIHQARNANIMAEIAGSKVLTEYELDSITLQSAIDEILGDERLMAEMSKKALKSALPDASAQIARHILSLAQLPVTKQ
ncbi:hypothetical protein QJS10_CPB12g00456 [Acorus calamus]|uniref:Undecaprenyldiphospho-muramoylpentapeptide beta-N-acetylglucosaminyltransferase n=1 Tax=Acorus calamus TaxID=4465 RepID=A0AAV9DMG6_ACOCL|nr:hypothetical protein QJS10_CPB12g00456 [Acorus calamus]